MSGDGWLVVGLGVTKTSVRHLLLAAGWGAAVSMAACGGNDQGAGSAAGRPSDAAMAPVPRPPTPSDSACPRDGRWKACALEDRINKAGMRITVLDTLTVPYFPERGVRYKIGKTATLAAFYFADSASGARATRDLDRLRLTPPRDSIGAWPAAPFEAVRSANLIAVLFGVNATQAERVRLAITAGAPQPASGGSGAPIAQPLPPAPAAR